MPQLDPLTWMSQYFWLLIFFLILYFRVTTFYLPKIAQILKIRAKTKEDDDAQLRLLSKEQRSARADYEKLLKEGLQITQRGIADTYQGFEIAVQDSFRKINGEILSQANQLYLERISQTQIAHHLLLDKIDKVCKQK